MIRKVDRRIDATGEVLLPCAPSMLDEYVKRLDALFAALGKPFSAEELSQMRSILERQLANGFAESAFSELVVRYETQPPPEPGIKYNVSTKVKTMADEYERWMNTREPPLFGKHPDAKVLTLASELGSPETIHVLDVGAGTGRNALALARLGHPTDAIEPAPVLAESLRVTAQRENLSVKVIEGDALDPSLPLERGRYKLVIAAEVVASHFRRIDQVRQLASRMCEALAPGGVLLFDAFLSADGFKPDAMSRELSQVFWSSLFTRHELKAALEGLPLTPIADESSHDFERAHLPEDAWPPTGWYEEWSQGLDLFALPAGKAPMELRWLSYRRS